MIDREHQTDPVVRAKPRSWLPSAASTAALVGAITVAAFVRLQSRDEVFQHGQIIAISNDASYHLRRVLRTAETFSYPGLFDPLLNWPRGAATHWSPGFDYLGAVVAALVGASGDRWRTAVVAVGLPVLFALLTALAAAHLATRLLPRTSRQSAMTVGASAALFVALLPQSVYVSRLGFVDHHVTEMLFVALLMGWTIAGVRTTRDTASLRARLWFEASGALLVTAAVWVQSVGLLYVGIASAALVVAPLVGDRPPGLDGHRVAGRGAIGLGVGAAALAALYLPAIREHGHVFAFEFPSLLQPACLGFAALGVGITHSVGLRPRARDEDAQRPLRRTLGVLLCAIVLLAAVVALLPELRRGFSQLLAFVATDSPDLANIDELRPLLAAPDSPDASRWDRLDAYFGLVGRLLPLLLGLGLWAARGAGPGRFAVTLVWTCLLLVMSLAQNRWSRSMAVPVAVLCALGLASAGERLARAAIERVRRARSGASATVGAWAGLLGSAGLLLAPHPLVSLGIESAKEPTSLVEAAMFLRSTGRSPEPGRRSGVVAPWHLTFPIVQISGLPVLSNGHAWLVGEDGYRLERAVWTGEPEALYALMDQRDLGFVVAGAQTMASVGVGGRRLSISRTAGSVAIDWSFFGEVPLGVLALGGTGLPGVDVPHVAELCPRFASSEFAGLEVPLPMLWVYERVAGAMLRGEAAPQSRVVAQIMLRHAAGVVPYEAYAVADDTGVFALRFPVPTRMKGATLQSGRAVRIHRRDEPVVELELPELAVRTGAKVPVPRPSPAAPPRSE